jgi:general secretion pathway protein C
MSARWWTFLVWALAAASALFWGLRLFVSPRALPERTPVAAEAPVARGDLTRLLGADPPPELAAAENEPPPDNRFQLIGVVAARPQAAREGVALIAVDGKPARAYRVGATVEGQTVLKSVAARGATLGPRDGAAQVTLSLAALPEAATGSLPAAEGGEGMVAPQVQPLPAMRPPGNINQGVQQLQGGLPPGNILAPQPAPQMGPQPRGMLPGMPSMNPQLSQQMTQQLLQQQQAQANRRVLPPPQPVQDPNQDNAPLR